MILYFSATGNTRWAAQRLSEALDERLVNMASMDVPTEKIVLAEGESLGICFPVHGWRPSILVREFIQQMNISFEGEPYVWAVCTAGDNIGETIDLLTSDLQQKGLTLSASCSLIMPESYVGLPLMDVDKPAKELHKKQIAAEQLEAFIPILKNREKGVHRLVRGRWPRINSRLIGHYFLHHLITDRPFRVDAEKCIHCGLCAKVCPVDNIHNNDNGLPEWLHTGRCLTCFACYHHCPKQAISFGSRTKGQYFFNRNTDTPDSPLEK